MSTNPYREFLAGTTAPVTLELMRTMLKEAFAAGYEAANWDCNPVGEAPKDWPAYWAALLAAAEQAGRAVGDPSP